MSGSGWFGRRGASATPPAPQGAAVQAQGVPLELIKYDQQSGRFELGREALAVLKQTRGPVGVVAVCGRARQVRRQGGRGGGAGLQRARPSGGGAPRRHRRVTLLCPQLPRRRPCRRASPSS